MPDRIPAGPPVETLDELYDNAPCGYVTLDRDGRIMWTNATFVDWIGVERSTIIRRRLRDLLSPAAQIFYETHCAPLLLSHDRVTQVALDFTASHGRAMPTLVDWRIICEKTEGGRDPVGTRIGYRVMIVNASERRANEIEIIRRSRHAALLAQFAASLLACNDPDRDALPELYAGLQRYAGVEKGASFIAQGTMLQLSFTYGLTTEATTEMATLPLGQAICGAVAHARTATQISDIQASDDPSLAMLKAHGIACYNCEPLLAGEELLGTIGFAGRAPSGFGSDELALFRSIADTLAIARQRNQARAQEKLLLAEVDHRAKNMLAIVQSVLNLSRADSIGEFVVAVRGRIHALSRAHGLLAAARWQAADLRQIVEDELATLLEVQSRIAINGEPVRLTPAAAQGMALVIHELATNAVKYGALAFPQGQLAVAWGVAADGQVAAGGGGEPRLRLSWRETGGVAVEPPTRRGFGTQVLRATVERELQGNLDQQWLNRGMACTIELPGSALIASPVQAAVFSPAGVPAAGFGAAAIPVPG